MLFRISSFLCTCLLLATAASQYPPSLSDDDIKTVKSPVDGNITISYKTPPVGTCTTVFSTQKQYTGYVHLPPYILAPIQQNYSINTFFWFIEARTSPETAPLTVYLNGGPGSSSMVGLFQEVGPCEAVEIAKGKIGTQPRDWGWDRSSNVLFVDQPNQVGFSYDTAINGSLDLLSSNNITEPPTSLPSGQPKYTFLNGTFSSQNANATANTTTIAAHAIWHMLQGFLATFPQYNPGVNNSTNSSVVGINLFAESYGGVYGPAFASYWEEQNSLLRSGTLSNSTNLRIKLTSLGIVQGCIDDLVQGIYYPEFAYNNTYGIQAISLLEQQTAANDFLSQGGCQQRIQACRESVSTTDPDDYGGVTNVNTICSKAWTYCSEHMYGFYESTGRDVYDITQKAADPFPPSTFLEYLNRADVQAAIGTPLNFTQSSTAVSEAFQLTGDLDRGDQIEKLASLLDSGVRVALIYGDKDFICNWLGGEAVSFSIAAQAEGYGPFYKAGYADIVVNSTYVGGMVRQYGNLSFSRIYEAGHLVPAYQPETVFTLFTRIVLGTGLSMGDTVNLTKYGTTGDANATMTNSAPSQNSPTCWVRDMESKCSDEQISKVQDGDGVVINGVWYSDSSDWKTPAASVTSQAGTPGSVPASMTASTATGTANGAATATTTKSMPTGVYIATATPSPTTTSSGVRLESLKSLLGVMMSMSAALLVLS